MDTRNPYVILGIPFGSSREEANLAFARRAKRLRGSGDRRQLTDLTWGFYMIDEAISHPDAAMEIYRIPADPQAFEADGAGVFRPPPELLRARGPATPPQRSARSRPCAAQAGPGELLRARAAQVPVPQP